MNNQISLLLTNLENCDKCSLGGFFGAKPIVPELKYPVELMVIGESPSKEESLLSSSYFDRHNKYIQDLIGKIFNNNFTYYTYLIKCFNEACLSNKKIKTCKENYLDQEIMLLKPKAIIYLGSFLAKINKVKIGDIGRDGNIIKGFWNSSFKVYTAGKIHIAEFETFLLTMKKEIEEYHHGLA